MAVNSITNLYMGGTAPDNGRHALLPSSNSGTYPAVGYADHQRRRSYQVTRQMRFSPRIPYGGLGNYPVTDLKDWCWYSDLVAGGSNVEVDDVWNLILIPPNTRLEYIAVWVFTGVTDLEFTVDQHDASGVAVGADTITGVGGAASGPTLKAITANVQTSASTRYVGIHFTAVPTDDDLNRLRNLDFAVQAEVVDWGSFDFNGNA